MPGPGKPLCGFCWGCPALLFKCPRLTQFANVTCAHDCSACAAALSRALVLLLQASNRQNADVPKPERLPVESCPEQPRALFALTLESKLEFLP